MEFYLPYMITMPKISILICTYNAEKYIHATIQSCLNQTFTDFELLILDNDSKDETVKYIQSFNDQRIQLFTSQKNLWPYGGLNFLLEKATGEYIAIQDHDDLRHPEKIAKQIDFLDSHREYVGCGTKTLMRYEGDHKGFEYFLWEKNYYTIHPSLVFRNAKHYRYPSIVYMADAVFQKKTLCHGKKIIYNLDETLTMHRVRAGASNYSYRRYKLTCQNLKTVFSLHIRWYAVFATLFELMRKIIYPVLHRLKASHLIDRIERLPFVLQRYKMKRYSLAEVRKVGFL